MLNRDNYENKNQLRTGALYKVIQFKDEFDQREPNFIEPYKPFGWLHKI